MKIVKHNSIQIQGHCTNFPGDIYNIEMREQSMYIGIEDEEYDVITSVVMSPEDAIQVAKEILNFYEGVIK